jgi:hypothetical protein
MTNEELLAAIRAIVREELATASAHKDELDLITAGPDENGRVRFLGTQKVNANCWIFSVLTVRQAVAGLIPELTEQQLAGIMMNVGCNEKGELLPAFGREYGQTGNPVIDETTYMANKVVKLPGTFWQPNRWAFAEPYAQSDTDRTISSRSTDIATLIASIEGLGSLHDNDGSSF